MKKAPTPQFGALSTGEGTRSPCSVPRGISTILDSLSRWDVLMSFCGPNAKGCYGPGSMARLGVRTTGDVPRPDFIPTLPLERYATVKGGRRGHDQLLDGFPWLGDPFSWGQSVAKPRLATSRSALASASNQKAGRRRKAPSLHHSYNPACSVC